MARRGAATAPTLAHLLRYVRLDPAHTDPDLGVYALYGVNLLYDLDPARGLVYGALFERVYVWPEDGLLRFERSAEEAGGGRLPRVVDVAMGMPEP
jgi:hypothetical protein